ncbi:tetratricopeptide repeat protein [Polymorphobacter fuscus]|uniref:Tetratricopeptide repeat protein n=1 Tax=Sandarakinorhabdus fusca TaxID=1439888 RepID=A0A7C9KWT2_9SPHN|nr:tetratricopeptide repeat protein [Polymorphobacter fuscus]KAB7648722.1 tetratricopeptide repeat protein [Polymorphobacter fuscus]MQT16286.1 tetratricopeptide repeat protein [Polymorphobacter fuscus]NJC07429.1 Tfp pilus assembly protein PilF [Polymorphobacter fuscus]
MHLRAAMAIFGLMMATAAGAAPTGDDILKPVSVRMADAGRAALARGDASGAIDNFEAALASDPKNVSAFTGIAQSYEKLGLPGKAVKYYREALALNPSDLAALEGQGKALIERGATARAQVNLARIKALCKVDCSAAARLQAALSAPVVAVADPPKAAPTKN